MNIVELNLRSNTNITLPYELFEFMKTAGEKEFYQLHDIGARSQNYMELALGHSHRINDRLTVGAKARSGRCTPQGIRLEERVRL